jgi:predicted MFS family arabinose efflux permease
VTQARSGIYVTTIVLAGAAVLLLAAFAILERLLAEPLVDLGLLRVPRFRAATVGSLLLGAGMIGMASFVPTIVQVGLGGSLWSASLLVLAWSGASVVTSLVVRRVRLPIDGPAVIASSLVVVAAGQLLALGLSAGSSPWRLVPSLVVSGLATGVLNAVLGRESVASVPPDRAAMGSGANNTARYLGAACGITVFVVVATHAGSLLDGWNRGVLVATAVTLVGAASTAASAIAHRRVA